MRKIAINPIKLNIGTRARDERTAEVHTNYSLWVGMGYLGGLKLLKRRRFVRVRSAEGICSYYLLTNPDRGKRFAFCSQFRKRVQISKEYAEKRMKIKL